MATTDTPPATAADARGALLPCPFCGGRAFHPDPKRTPYCGSCHAEGPVTDEDRQPSPEELVAGWNTRAALSAEVTEAPGGLREAWTEFLLAEVEANGKPAGHAAHARKGRARIALDKLALSSPTNTPSASGGAGVPRWKVEYEVTEAMSYARNYDAPLPPQTEADWNKVHKRVVDAILALSAPPVTDTAGEALRKAAMEVVHARDPVARSWAVVHLADLLKAAPRTPAPSAGDFDWNEACRSGEYAAPSAGVPASGAGELTAAIKAVPVNGNMDLEGIILDCSPNADVNAIVQDIIAAARRSGAGGEGLDLGPEEISYQAEQGEDGVVAETFSVPEAVARREALHYAAEYGQDGPVSLFRVSRREWRFDVSRTPKGGDA